VVLRIQVNGVDLDDAVEVASVTVNNGRAGIGLGAVDDFPLGARVEIAAGYGVVATIFEGEIVEHTAAGDGHAIRFGVVLAGAIPQRTPGDAPVLTLQWGETIQEFESRTDGAKRRGRVRSRGTSLAAPGNTIELAGIGVRFDGVVVVSAVRHEIANGTWTTELTFGAE